MSLIFKSERQVKERAKKVAHSILDDNPDLLTFPDRYFPLIVLKGGLPWATEVLLNLSREGVGPELTYDFVKVGRYGAEQKGRKQLNFSYVPAFEHIKGKHVLLLEDIIDEGHTLSQLIEMLSQSLPASILISALVDKAPQRQIEIPEYNPRYTGFTYKGRKWLRGWGMDDNEKGRLERDISIIPSR